MRRADGRLHYQKWQAGRSRWRFNRDFPHFLPLGLHLKIKASHSKCRFVSFRSPRARATFAAAAHTWKITFFRDALARAALLISSTELAFNGVYFCPHSTTISSPDICITYQLLIEPISRARLHFLGVALFYASTSANTRTFRRRFSWIRLLLWLIGVVDQYTIKEDLDFFLRPLVRICMIFAQGAQKDRRKLFFVCSARSVTF